MLRNVALTAAVPFAVALLGSLLAVWIGIGRGLAPLERLRGVLASRRADDDSALPQQKVPRELAPLVGTIARLLERVRSTITRERRFTDDAAHELRTPLTAVKTHLQVLRLSLGRQLRPAVADALEHADEGVLRMQRSLEQLLLLARLEAQAPELAGTCDAEEARARLSPRSRHPAQGPVPFACMGPTCSEPSQCRRLSWSPACATFWRTRFALLQEVSRSNWSSTR